jgi:hypothetical protein
LSDPNNVARAAANKEGQVMRKSSWLVQITIGLLLPSAGFADDANSTNIDDDPSPVVTVSLDRLLEESRYGARWQLYHPVAAITHSDEWSQEIADIEFQDNSTLGRLGKLRNLSLLTLAETVQTRLFLGVNDDGLAGLHFVTIPRHGDARFLSLARMPYLKRKEPDGRRGSVD